MADILQEINERIEKAEKDRDEALNELSALKKKLSSNGIYIRDGSIYMIATEGGGGWLCWHCPLFQTTSADSGDCTVHRDCYVAGGGGKRAYSLTEIRRGFLRRQKQENKVVMDYRNLKTMAREMRKIADTMNKAVAKADEMCKWSEQEEKETKDGLL